MSPRTTPRRSRRTAGLAVVALVGLPLGVVSSAPAATALPPALCPPALPGHDCAALAPTLPLDLDFRDAADLSAFTMTQASTSGTFKPENLAVDPSGTGVLRMTTTAGSNYLGATGTPAGNSLDNGLGVGLDGTRTTTASVTLTDLPKTGNAGEGFGLWFGPGEDDYVKLVVTSTTGGALKPQLVREVGGVSTSADERNGKVQNLTGGSITLTLVADPTTRTVTGSYTLADGTTARIGALTVPAEFFELPGQRAATPGASTFLGLFASQRRNKNALTVGVDRFTVTQDGVPDVKTSPRLALTPTDAVPGGRVVLNKIQTPQDSKERTHSSAGVTLANTGDAPATITGLSTTGPFAVSGVTLPLTLAPGASVVATVSATATTATFPGATKGRTTGTLDVAGDGGVAASLPLDGWWQRYSERGLEPTLGDLVSMFGYTTALPTPINRTGAYKAWSADEVLSPYWNALDATKPVTVTQLASFHTYPSFGYLRWFPQGDTGKLGTVIAHSNLDAQSVLPRTARPELGDATGLARSSFTPTSTFGFLADDEYSDPTLNDDTVDRSKGCKTAVCGHHLRVFVVRDSAGNVVPGTYLLGQDQASINYDYQDNLFLVENVTPAG